jgi:hypothetical protein
MDRFVYLKNLNFVLPIKTRDLVPPLTRAQGTEALYNFKGLSHRMGDGRNSLKISAPLALIKSFRMILL